MATFFTLFWRLRGGSEGKTEGSIFAFFSDPHPPPLFCMIIPSTRSVTEFVLALAVLLYNNIGEEGGYSRLGHLCFVPISLGSVDMKLKSR